MNNIYINLYFDLYNDDIYNVCQLIYTIYFNHKIMCRTFFHMHTTNRKNGDQNIINVKIIFKIGRGGGREGGREGEKGGREGQREGGREGGSSREGEKERGEGRGMTHVPSSPTRYSLSEHKLIRQKMDAEVLTVMVEAGEGSRVSVKVLDCDTISQVKEKLLDAIYKSTPISKRPSLTSVDIGELLACIQLAMV